MTLESEDNDSDRRADGPLCSGFEVVGTIDDRRDVDWFRFDVAAAGTVSVVLDHDIADDFDWDVYAETGGALASGATAQVPETGAVTVDSAGLYFLKVSQYAGSGDYTLTVRFPDQPGDGGGDPPCADGPRPSKPGGLRTWLTGSSDDVCVVPTGPALLLMGGGPDVDSAFERVAPIVSGGDVVVLRTSGSDAYNGYLDALTGADSVETLRVDRRNHADSDYVAWAVRTAEFVFMAGGDQSTYLNAWQGTRLEDALHHVVARGGVVGGTSAGLAVLGEVVYDPDGLPSVYSDEAVTDACHPYTHLATGFLSLPHLDGVVTDSHFAARDRFGRLLAFMAALGEPSIAPTATPVTGIGVDEETALTIDAAGVGVVDGSGSVYVLRDGTQTVRTQVECGSAVRYDGVERFRLESGDHFDFASGQSSVAPLLVGIDGRFSSFYQPSNPY